MTVTDEVVVRAAQNHALFSAVYRLDEVEDGWVVRMLRVTTFANAGGLVPDRVEQDLVVAGPFPREVDAGIARQQCVMRAVLEALEERQP